MHDIKLYLFLDHSNTFITYGVTGAVTIGNGIFVQVLSIVNKKSRLSYANLHQNLSHKSQIVENIRVLSVIRPQICIEMIFGIVAIVVGFVVRQFNENAGHCVYFTVYQFFIIVSAVFWMTKSRILCFRNRRKITSYEEQDSFGRIKVKSVIGPLGKLIRASETADQHFYNLKDMWN